MINLGSNILATGFARLHLPSLLHRDRIRSNRFAFWTLRNSSSLSHLFFTEVFYILHRSKVHLLARFEVEVKQNQLNLRQRRLVADHMNMPNPTNIIEFGSGTADETVITPDMA